MTEDKEFEKHNYDVLIIGAGGSGLRAAIAAHEAGLRVAVICKSLFGKAHTVMAEGGCAAAMGNANSNDNWQVHFRDTMRGGKFLNNWRMAELHAKEAPDRVWELETYGALFDRTKDGHDQPAQLRRPRVPAPRPRRRPHRPRADPHDAAEDRLAAAGRRPQARPRRRRRGPAQGLRRGDDHRADHRRQRRDLRRVRLLPRDRRVRRCSGRPSVVLATGGIGKSFKVTSNSWECTGDGMALALRAGLDAAEHGVRPVPPHRHGLAARRSRASSSPRACAVTAAC